MEQWTCVDLEKYVKVDTMGEYSGVTLVCMLCGREIHVDDISKPERGNDLPEV